MTMATFQPALTAAEVLRQIAVRRIGLTCCLDGKLWVVSADLKGDGVAMNLKMSQQMQVLVSRNKES